MKKYLGVLAAVLFSMAGVARTAHAQYSDQNAQDQNAPDQGQYQNQDSSQVKPAVGRLSLIHGDVSVQRGDSGDWVAATVNTPLEAGDRVSTGNGGRAEVQLDYANVIRLDENSTIRITDLTATHIQIQAGQGLVEYSVFKNSQADAEIDTPNSAVHPLRDGDYRIQVNGDSDSQLIVRSGQAEVSEPQGSTRIESGQMIDVQGTDNPQYQTLDAPRKDNFDQWNENRDRTILDAQSWQHTDRYYTGTQDLDAYGQWQNVPDYGQVWVPAQNSGWAPYRDGQWVWEPYYGWTWVSYEPWGWAPYHYGRWFVYGGNWAWWPGPVGVYGGWGYNPIWSPAYVSFFGWGDDFDFGFGFGNVGWLPIGPADPFCPWWGRGVNQVNVVNITNITNITNINNNNFSGLPVAPLFRGRNGFSNISRVENDVRIRNGISSVRGNEFGRGGDVRFQRGIGAGQLRKASFMTGRLPVAPTQQSLGRLQRNVPPAIARTASLNNKRFFSQSKPTFTPRPFTQQQQRAQQIIARSRMQNGTINSRGNSTMNGSRMPTAPAMQQRNGNAQTTRPFSNGGVRSTNGVATTPNGRFNAPPQSSVRPGWHSFGGNGRPTTPQGSMPNRGAVQNQVPNRGAMRQQVTPAQQRPNTFSRPSAPPVQRPGWRSFTPSSGGNNPGGGFRQPQAPARMNQPTTSRPPVRFEQQNPSPQQRGGGGWHTFTPSQQSRPQGNTAPTRPGFQNFSSRSSQPQREWSAPARPNNSGSYRRSLDMHQPIVSRRAPSNYGGGTPQRYGGGSPYGRPNSGYSPRPYSGGGSYGGPSGGGYRGPSPSYSRPPSGGGGYRGPSPSYSRPSGGGGGGYRGGGSPSFSRPSGGGGPRGGGGGPHPSAPHGGGGRPHR